MSQLSDQPVFEPEATKAITEAFFKVCQDLKLNGDAGVKEAVAVKNHRARAARRTRPGADSREGAPRSKARRSQALVTLGIGSGCTPSHLKTR